MKKVDHEKRRVEIAQAAASIIATKGLETLTTRHLAKTMDCSIGVLSHYYANKDQIVIAALNWADRRIDQRFEQSLIAPLAVENFETVIMSAFPLDAQSDMEWRVRLNLAAYSLTHPVLALSQAKKHQTRTQRLITAIGELQDQGVIINTVSSELLVQNATDIVTGMAYNLLAIPMAQRAAKVSFVIEYLKVLQAN